jgi:hypothetical protein
MLSLLLSCTGAAVLPTVDPPEGQEAVATCALVSDLDAPTWIKEGNRLRFTLSCQDRVPEAGVEITPVYLPDGAEFDRDDLEISWTPGEDDAGPAEFVFSVRVPDQDIPNSYGFDAYVMADIDSSPDPDRYTQEWGLPVFHLTSGEALSQSDKDVEVHFEGVEYVAQAKIRGASSAAYPKPSYTLEFPEEELDLKDLWGKKRNHLILLTTFDDNSYVRQKLIYDQWAAMAEYWGQSRLTPRSFFCVLYLNGNYQGLYVALDRPDDEFIRHMGLDDSGNLYKAVNHDASFYSYDYYGNPKGDLAAGYVKKEGLPEEDYEDLRDFVSFTANSNASELSTNLQDWAPAGEFMDWFLLVYYSLSEDSAGKNSYLYHNPESDLWRYIPWDFNHAWGQNWYTLRTDTNFLNDYYSRNRIFWAFQTDGAGADRLWGRYTQMRADGPLHPDWITGQLDGYYAKIQPSAEKDWEQWGRDYETYGYWSSARSGTWQDFEGEKDYLYDWVQERAEVMDREHGG